MREAHEGSQQRIQAAKQFNRNKITPDFLNQQGINTNLSVTLTAGQLHWSVHKVYNKLAALSLACYKSPSLSDHVAA